VQFNTSTFTLSAHFAHAPLRPAFELKQWYNDTYGVVNDDFLLGTRVDGYPFFFFSFLKSNASSQVGSVKVDFEASLPALTFERVAA
ncbi:hypothetical protein HDU97_009804, partial [Phlyctochytrium planicorne]